MHDDRALVGALLRGRSEAAFRALYRRHTPRLYALVLRVLGGSEPDAEDVVQETWIRACEKLPGFAWRSAFATWLAAIALNLCREQLRRTQRRPVEALTDGHHPALPEPSVGAFLDLERAIERLPDGYRAVLVLHDVEGYTHDEIGARLGIAAGTSKSQLHWARRAVRTLLAGHRGEEHVPR